jgi:ribosome-binding factor A
LKENAMSRRHVRTSRAATPRPDRKTLQLCSQVARELQFILMGECDDDLLRELQVESVLPAPNSSRLLVSVSSAAIDDPAEMAEMLHRLHQQMGFLRSEVAMSINRRKAPELMFRVVKPGAGEMPAEE